MSNDEGSIIVVLACLGVLEPWVFSLSWSPLNGGDVAFGTQLRFRALLQIPQRHAMFDLVSTGVKRFRLLKVKEVPRDYESYLMKIS